MPVTLNETVVLSAGNMTLPGTGKTSTPFTAVPPNDKLMVCAEVLADEALIVTVAGSHPFTIVWSIPSIVVPMESRRSKL